MIEVKNVEKSFGDSKVLKGITTTFETGKTNLIIGQSGSGKTVLSRASMGLLTMSTAHRTGTVIFDGQDLSTAPRDTVRSTWGTGMAMIFQDPMTALNPVRRIGSQLTEGLRVRLGMSKKEARGRAIELLKLVRIPDPEKALRKFPNQLSGGMRQRVMIAIALACNPKLLFADEPTTALDVTVQAQILQLLSDLRKELNMSMVLVTHDLGVVAGHTDKIAVMYAGEVVEYGETKELFANVRMPYTEALLNSIPRLDQKSSGRMTVIEGRLPDPTKPEPA